MIAGLQVGKDWLKLQPTEEAYRAHLERAFQHAKAKYQLRKQQKLGLQPSDKTLEKTISTLETQRVDQAATLSHKTCEPELPSVEQGRFMMTKIGRNCMKKQITRYMDVEKNEMVQYGKEDSQKPSKRLPMKDVRITIECANELEEKKSAVPKAQQQQETSKHNEWHNKEMQYRVKIVMPSRAEVPIYHYTDSLGKAQMVKFNLKQMAMSEDEIARAKELVHLLSILFKVAHLKPVYFDCVLSLALKNRQKVRFYRNMAAISSNFAVSVVNIAKQINNLPPVLAAVEKTLHSTLKYGLITNNQYSQNTKAYLTMVQQRSLQVLKRLVKNRRFRRPESFTKQIARVEQLKTVSTFSGSYKVNQNVVSAIQAGLPYPTKDAATITRFTLPTRQPGGDRLVFSTAQGDFAIPLSEVCHLAVTPEGRKAEQFELELAGRRIRRPGELLGGQGNLMPYSLGYERTKQSRLDTKQVIKFSLKGITIPESMFEFVSARYQYNYKMANGKVDTIKSTKFNAIFRLRFELDGFHADSTFFYPGPNAKLGKDQCYALDLTEDLTVDLVESVRNVKVTLLGVYGRPQTNKFQILNELGFEEELATFILNTDTIQADVSGELHRRPFTILIEPGAGGRPMDTCALSCRIERRTVAGNTETTEMEGSQLLVGRHVIYANNRVGRVVRVVDKKTCEIELINTPGIYDQRVVQASLSKDVTLIERYGISQFNLDDLPLQYSQSQFEWSVRLALPSRDRVGILAKINEAIQALQARKVFQQRMTGQRRVPKQVNMIAGNLDLYLLSAHNLPSKVGDQVFLKIRFQSQPDLSQEQLRAEKELRDEVGDNEESFIATDKNCAQKVQNNIELKSLEKPAAQNILWWTPDQPEGNLFKLGLYMKKIPMIFKLTLCKSGKELILGHAQLFSEDLISLDDPVRTLVLHLNDALGLDSYICIRTVFTPTEGTLKRNGNSQMPNLLCHEILKTMKKASSEGQTKGQRVPKWELQGELSALRANAAFFSKLFKTQEDKEHISYSIANQNALFEIFRMLSEAQTLNEKNKDRPILEDDTILFCRALIDEKINAYSQSLNERNIHLWENFIADVQKTGDGLVVEEDQLAGMDNFSVTFSNTTKYLTKMYKNRLGQLGSQIGNQNFQLAAKKRQQEQADPNGLPDNLKFSAIFASEWKKEDLTDPDSWKYSTLWHLLVLGVPMKLRVHLWKDFLRVQLHQQEASKVDKIKSISKDTQWIYRRFRETALKKGDNVFFQQVEEDIREYTFQSIPDSARREIIRYKVMSILKAFGIWANEYSQSKNKTVIYNKSLIPIISRMLTMNQISNQINDDYDEDSAFWMLVGMVVNLKKMFTIDGPSEGPGQNEGSKHRGSIAIDKREEFNKEREIRTFPLLSRKVCFKNEMVIIISLIKIHYPQVFAHLKSLSIPLEWYFYDAVSTFYSDILPEELLFRLWDMVFLSSCDDDQKKRALWYILIVPLYMIQVNQKALLSSQDPLEIKNLLLSSPLNPTLYNPFSFVPEILVLIKQCFVTKPMTRFSQYIPIKYDNASELEKVRSQVESNFYAYEVNAVQDFNLLNWVKNQASTFIKPGQFQIRSAELLSASEKLISDAQCVINVLALKNAEADLDRIQITYRVEGQENSVPDIKMNQNGDKSHLPERAAGFKVNLRGQVASKVIEIDVRQGQRIIGTGYLPVNKILNCQVLTLVSLKLHPSDARLPPIILELQIQTLHQQKPTLTAHGTISDQDIDSLCIDDQEKFREHFMKSLGIDTSNQAKLNQEIAKIISNQSINTQNVIGQYVSREKTVRELTNEGGIRYDGYHNIDKIIPNFTALTRDAGIYDQMIENATQIMLKYLAFNHNIKFENFAKIVYSLFDPMTVVDAAKIIHHLYKIANYPVIFGEILNLVSMSVNKEYSNVIKVSQQAVSEDIGFLDKILGRQQEVTKEFDVTTAFKHTLNRVINLTGQIDSINFNVAPYNNINFWLPGDFNKIRAQRQQLRITVKDFSGNQHQYQLTFTSSGFLEVNATVMPLHQLYGSPALPFTEFYKIITQEMPMISSIMSQILFLRASSKKLDEYDGYFIQDVTITQEEGGKMVFTFGQNPGLAAGLSQGVKQVEYKGNIESRVKAQIQIPGLQLYEQDTFLTLKAKIFQSFKERGINVMTEQMQFRSYSVPFTQYNILDRINSRKPLENVLELVRVDVQKPQNLLQDFPSYGLYTHPSGQREWLPCRILSKDKPSHFRLEFQHERHLRSAVYVLERADILFSLADKQRSFPEMIQQQISQAVKTLEENQNRVLQKLNQ